MRIFDLFLCFCSLSIIFLPCLYMWLLLNFNANWKKCTFPFFLMLQKSFKSRTLFFCFSFRPPLRLCITISSVFLLEKVFKNKEISDGDTKFLQEICFVFNAVNLGEGIKLSIKVISKKQNTIKLHLIAFKFLSFILVFDLKDRISR